MPDRSVKMKRRILGFQRRVWWPKWTPASSSSRMETTALGAPFVVDLALLRWARGAPAAKAGTRAAADPPGRGTGTGSLARGGPKPRIFEVGRQRRHDVELLARHGMGERESRRVQELPFEPKLAGSAVDRVARDRKVDCSEVHPDLVRPTCLERDAQQRMAREQL